MTRTKHNCIISYVTVIPILRALGVVLNTVIVSFQQHALLARRVP